MIGLTLVRHGHSSPDGEPRYWGQTDNPLSERGKKQAGRLQWTLAGLEFQHAFSSDLIRCLDTAVAILGERRISALPCPELREISFGDWEGRSYAELAATGQDLRRYWNPAYPQQRFPAGESTVDLANRVDDFRRRVSGLPAGEALVVAHGGTLKMLACQLLGLLPQQWWQLRLDLASISRFELHPAGAIMVRWNDTSHLDCENRAHRAFVQ